MQYHHITREREPASPSPPRPLTLIQYNCLGSGNVFLSLFSLFSQLAHLPSIVALQYPPVYSSKLPSFQLSSSFSPPNPGNNKPLFAFYVLSSFCSPLLYFRVFSTVGTLWHLPFLHLRDFLMPP